MEPVFLLQIVDRSGQVAQLPAGGQLEADLVALFTSHIMAKGVALKSAAHVQQDIRDGIHDAIMALKKQTIALV